MPRAFLCHASENKAVAERIARALVAAGVETFFDRWEIRAGDSLRQKIDAGIAGCTHFIVLISPESILKPWVNAELDAGFVRRLQGLARLIPLRLGVQIGDLPPLLQGLHSPSVDQFDVAVQNLVADIHGLTNRPQLGAAPDYTRAALSQSAGLSMAAGRIAEEMVRQSKSGRAYDPGFDMAELRAILPVGDEDLAEAVDELENLSLIYVRRALNVGPLGIAGIGSTPRLFAQLDSYVKPWNPAEDARVVAAELTNSGSLVVQVLAERLAWPPRRMNPATTYLVESGAAQSSRSGDINFEHYCLFKNVATRRFLRE